MLVAIHGLSSNTMSYVGIAERLAGRRPLLAVDLGGHGDSDKPADGYGMAVHADDVATAMDTDGIDRAVVVGHSMGAGVATVFAHRHPDRCAGVVLFDGGLQAFHDFFNRPELAAEFMDSGKGVEGRLHTTFADRPPTAPIGLPSMCSPLTTGGRGSTPTSPRPWPRRPPSVCPTPSRTTPSTCSRPPARSPTTR